MYVMKLREIFMKEFIFITGFMVRAREWCQWQQRSKHHRAGLTNHGSYIDGG